MSVEHNDRADRRPGFRLPVGPVASAAGVEITSLGAHLAGLPSWIPLTGYLSGAVLGLAATASALLAHARRDHDRARQVHAKTATLQAILDRLADPNRTPAEHRRDRDLYRLLIRK